MKPGPVLRESDATPSGALALDASDVLSAFVPRLRRGIGWTVAGALINQGSTLTLSVAVANMLGPRTFGAYAIVLTTSQTLAAVAQLATELMARKYVAEFRTTSPERAGRVLGLLSAVSTATGVLFSLGLLMAAPWVASYVLRTPEVEAPLRLASVIVLFTVLNGWQIGAMAGLESYSAIAWGSAVGGLLYLLCGFGGVWAGGLSGSLAGMAVGSLLRWMIVARLTRRELARHGLVIDRSGISQERALLYDFAVPAAIAGAISAPSLWLSSAILIRQPDGHHQMALYAAANMVRVLLLYVPQLASTVSTSLLSHARGADDHVNYWRVLWLNGGAIVGSTGVGCLAVLAVGPRLLLLFGSTFDAAYPVLLVLLMAALVEAVMIALYQVPLSEGRMWASLFQVKIPRDLLIVSLSFFLAPRYGAVGVAWAYAAGWCLASLLVLPMVRHVRRPRVPPRAPADVGGLGS